MGTPDAPGGASEAGRVDDPFDWRVTKAGEVMIGRGVAPWSLSVALARLG